VITRAVKKIQETGVKAAEKFRDRKRSIKKRMLLINKVLKRRSKENYTEVRNITQQILTIAESVVAKAREIAEQVEHSATAGSLVNNLKTALARTERIIWQTEEVQKGNTHISERLIILFDDRARPIKKGKLNAPVEFGYKLCLSEAENNIITDYEVLQENPSDDRLLIGMVDRHTKRFRRPPRDVATDRGFSSASNEASLRQRGVRRISLPRKGKVSDERKAYQEQSWFKRLQRWRAGGEATISLLKRRYGLSRSRLRGKEGNEIWVGWGIMTCNLRRISAEG
jgi:IS5 family transposase